MNNKNVSVWRGDSTPPTQYHLWLKNDGKLYVNIDEQWQEIDKDSVAQITETLNQHATKLDNHQTALDDINTLHSKLWTPGKGSWSIMSQGVKNSIGDDLTKGALGTYSYAEGQLTTATGDASHAEGFLSRATAIHAHAEGFDSEASGEKSHAEGYQTVTSAIGSHAEGFKTHAKKVYSHAEGNTTIASGSSSHAEGIKSEASGEGAHAEGSTSYASGPFSHAEGSDTQAQGSSSHAEGHGCSADVDGAHAEGISSRAEGFGAHAENNSHAEGRFSHSEGSSHTFGTLAHAEGQLTQANGTFSHSEGNSTISNGEASHAEGLSTKAEKTASHAEGNQTTAQESSSHAEGKGTTASGEAAHAEGILTEAIWTASHAEGFKTEAHSAYSHAEGSNTQAHGEAAHAEGYHTSTGNTAAHAEGFYTEANGAYSHTEGSYTVASVDNAHAQGRYNIGSALYLHSIGIGTKTQRKNSEYVYFNPYVESDVKNGYKYLIGIGGYDGISTDVTTYKSLQEVISDVDSTLKVKADLVDGKIPLEQLGNLDMVLFEVVKELPTTNIKKHIYLMKVSELESGTKNLYAEYIYTGDITATYDASKWEKLGVKQIETDLSDYYTKEETDSQIQAVKNKFPLQVASFTVSPNVCAIGTTNVTLKWAYNNEDINPITSQSLNDITLDKALRTKTESVSSDTATTKTFTLKANALSKTVTVYIVNNSYYGVVSADTTTITDTTGLKVSTQYGRAATIAFTQANQKIVYLYPSVFGDLTSIKDQNGFEGISGFDKQSLMLNGVSYNLYISKIPATSNVTLTFK